MIKKIGDLKLEETTSKSADVENKIVTTFKSSEERKAYIDNLKERLGNEIQYLTEEEKRNKSRKQLASDKLASLKNLK